MRMAVRPVLRPALPHMAVCGAWLVAVGETQFSGKKVRCFGDEKTVPYS